MLFPTFNSHIQWPRCSAEPIFRAFASHEPERAEESFHFTQPISDLVPTRNALGRQIISINQLVIGALELLISRGPHFRFRNFNPRHGATGLTAPPIAHRDAHLIQTGGQGQDPLPLNETITRGDIAWYIQLLLESRGHA